MLTCTQTKATAGAADLYGEALESVACLESAHYLTIQTIADTLAEFPLQICVK